MSMWTAIVLIVIAAMAGEAWRNYVKARASSIKPDEIDALKKRIDDLDGELRDRIQTLERIVTDRHGNLKEEFENLERTG